MDDNQKNERIDSEENNTNELNDSQFQKEGEYYMKKKPKFKYVIKIVHPSPNEINRPKTPDKIISSERFTIINNNKNPNKKKYLNNNEYENESNIKYYNSRSLRIDPTIRFYTGDSYLSKDIKRDTFEKSYTHYLRRHQRYNNKNNYNCTKNDGYYENDDNYYYRNNDNYYYRNNDNDINYCQNDNNNYYSNYYNHYNCCHCCNCCNCCKNDNKYNYNKNEKHHNRCKNDTNYIIEIYPTKPCICQRVINKSINDYYDTRFINCNNYKDRYHNNCRCLHDMNDNRNMNDYYLYRNDINDRNDSIKEKEKSIQNKYRSENINTPYQNNSSKNNYYYDINSNIIDNLKKIKNMKKTSQKISQLKKITIRNNRINYNDITETNNSFLSVDNINNKNMSPDNNTFSINKINNKKYLYSPNNLNNTMTSKGRKSGNVMIHKSSDRKERLKIVKIGEKIKPLEVKKSVEKPKKETIINENGKTINVIKQTYVLTSIETKPLINDNNNSKDEQSFKERITNIYTTLTRHEIDENNDQLNDENKENESEENKDAQKSNKDSINNLNSNENNININDNIDREKYIINNSNNNVNDNFEVNNDLLTPKNNNNNSFNQNSQNSNIYEMSEQYNIRISDRIKYIKYLYYRYTNLTSHESVKEESLSNYFLKLNEDEKIGILNKLNDGNNEDKKIYNKLMSILKEKGLKLNNDQEDKMK